jgi:hypothetical protein
MKTLIIRIACDLCIIGGLVLGFGFWVLPFVVYVSIRFFALELVVLAFLIDTQFSLSTEPILTIFAVVWLIVTEWIKPQLRPMVTSYTNNI